MTEDSTTCGGGAHIWEYDWTEAASDEDSQHAWVDAEMENKVTEHQRNLDKATRNMEKVNAE